MIVDSSALMAILNGEDDAAAYASALRFVSRSSIAAPTLLEVSIVATRRRWQHLDRLRTNNAVETIAFTPDHALIAREAYARYGKGSGSPARLNFGDCISYALAKATGQPLLFKGDDFTHTDIESAI